MKYQIPKRSPLKGESFILYTSASIEQALEAWPNASVKFDGTINRQLTSNDPEQWQAAKEACKALWGQGFLVSRLELAWDEAG